MPTLQTLRDSCTYWDFFVFLICCGSDSSPFILQNSKDASRGSWRCQANNRNRAAFLFGVNTHSSLKRWVGADIIRKWHSVFFLVVHSACCNSPKQPTRITINRFQQNHCGFSVNTPSCWHVFLVSRGIVQPGKTVMLFTVWDGVKPVHWLAVYSVHCIKLQSLTTLFEGKHCAIV